MQSTAAQPRSSKMQTQSLPTRPTPAFSTKSRHTAPSPPRPPRAMQMNAATKAERLLLRAHAKTNCTISQPQLLKHAIPFLVLGSALPFPRHRQGMGRPQQQQPHSGRPLPPGGAATAGTSPVGSCLPPHWRSLRESPHFCFTIMCDVVDCWWGVGLKPRPVGGGAESSTGWPVRPPPSGPE